MLVAAPTSLCLLLLVSCDDGAGPDVDGGGVEDADISGDADTIDDGGSTLDDYRPPECAFCLDLGSEAISADVYGDGTSCVERTLPLEGVSGGAFLAVDFYGSPGVQLDHTLDAAASVPREMSFSLERGFSAVVEVRVDMRPRDRAVILSQWHIPGDDRAFELGIDQTQYPYILVSSDGTWSTDQAELKSTLQVRLGQPYRIAFTVEPDRRMAIFLNGRLVAEETDDVPPSIHVSEAELIVGHRPGSRSVGLTGSLGRLCLFEAPLPDALLRERPRAALLDSELGHPPTRQLTSGSAFHWFGYYDKLETDPTGRYVLSMEVDFEHRTPQGSDVAIVGMVDLVDDDRWIELGESRAWSWQQGSMLQWRPGSDTEVLWNDVERSGGSDAYVTRVLDVASGAERTLPRPVHHVSPRGDVAVGSDFSRWAHMRPGYGYTAIPDPARDELAPESSTIYLLDLESGESEDLFTLAEVAAIPHSTRDLSTARHYFSVMQFDKSGDRFLFFHRWIYPGGGFQTRIFTANVDGSELQVLTEDAGLSHMDWQEDGSIVVWTSSRGGYARYEIGVGFVEMLYSYRNGHQTFLEGGQWMLTDTYPDADGDQHPYLYNLWTDEIFVLGHFASPPEYGGSSRVDTHPRISSDRSFVVIDSPHSGGRQLHWIDVRDILR
jgi:hypothetical protein